MLAHSINALDDLIHEASAGLAILRGHGTQAHEVMSSPIMQQLISQAQDGMPLKFLLPAFPAKSPSIKKTAGFLPDLGEVLALQSLNRFCARLAQVYAPGAQVLICSDGRIFSDVVGVSDETIDGYQAGIEGIIAEFGLEHLSTFSMDDLFPELAGDELRQRVLWQFGKCAEEIRHQVLTQEDGRALFNGLHKFMVEDQQGLHPEKSRNQVNKETKPLTYELMRRSDAWSQLLNHYLKGCLRLSIHPYPLTHEKFGVHLVSSSNKWATPWHNVTVKIADSYQLMHLERALELNAKKKTLGGKYVYFEV